MAQDDQSFSEATALTPVIDGVTPDGEQRCAGGASLRRQGGMEGGGRKGAGAERGGVTHRKKKKTQTPSRNCPRRCETL